MKVLAPVKNLLSWVALIKAWAQEIYFWVVSEDWESKHHFKSILNRRDGRLANITSYEEGKKLVDFARANGTSSYITLNNSPVINDEALIIDEIKKCISIRPDAVIVKDIYIASMIRELDKNIDIHCSSLNQVLNNESVRFWVDNFRISRMILPRNVSVNEIIDLCDSFPELEFEIFVKNDWCYNSDGVCSSLHLEWLKEWIPYVCNREALYQSEWTDFNEAYLGLTRSTLDCKVCMISQLKHLKNLASLKIVGREKSLDIILKDLKFVQSAIDYSRLTDDNDEFIDFNIANHKKNLQKDCFHKKCEVYHMYHN